LQDQFISKPILIKCNASVSLHFLNSPQRPYYPERSFCSNETLLCTSTKNTPLLSSPWKLWGRPSCPLQKVRERK